VQSIIKRNASECNWIWGTFIALSLISSNSALRVIDDKLMVKLKRLFPCNSSNIEKFYEKKRLS